MASAVAKRHVFEPASIRSMFIRVSPVPRGLAQRRAVLQALQKYGEVEVFKGLLDPASFVSVSAQSSTASRLVENSPLQFDVVTEQHVGPLSSLTFPKQISASEVGAIGDAAESSRVEAGGIDAPSKANRDGKTTFTLHIFSTTTYAHKTTIRHSPLHGPWPDDEPSSFVSSALRHVVPKDMAARGLWDWETGCQSERGGPKRHEEFNHAQERLRRKGKRQRSTGLFNLRPEKQGPKGSASGIGDGAAARSSS